MLCQWCWFPLSLLFKLMQANFNLLRIEKMTRREERKVNIMAVSKLLDGGGGGGGEPNFGESKRAKKGGQKKYK